MKKLTGIEYDMEKRIIFINDKKKYDTLTATNLIQWWSAHSNKSFK